MRRRRAGSISSAMSASSETRDGDAVSLIYANRHSARHRSEPKRAPGRRRPPCRVHTRASPSWQRRRRRLTRARAPHAPRVLALVRARGARGGRELPFTYARMCERITRACSQLAYVIIPGVLQVKAGIPPPSSPCPLRGGTKGWADHMRLPMHRCRRTPLRESGMAFAVEVGAFDGSLEGT